MQRSLHKLFRYLDSPNGRGGCNLPSSDGNARDSLLFVFLNEVV